MDHRYFRYDAYSGQNHDVEQGGASPESSHTGGDFSKRETRPLAGNDARAARF